MVKKNLHLATYSILFSLIISGSSFAQDNWDFQGILAEQNSSGGSENSSVTNVDSGDELKPVNVNAVSSCGITKESQNTLPLSYLKKLAGPGDFFTIKEVPGTNKVSITSSKMISECNDMIEPSIDMSSSDPIRYFVKVNVKAGKKVSDFVDCINQKAMIDGKPNPKASVGTISLDFSFEKSGELSFVSHGPLASNAPEIRGCNYIEPISKAKLELLTVNDRDKRLRQNDVTGICNRAESYKDISDETIAKYQEYKAILESIRNELLLEEVKKLAKSIQTGDDLSGLDFSVISDFKKYVIDPLMEEIKLTYQEFQGAQGDARKALEKKYKELKSKLASYGKSPFLSESDYNKLMAKGQFDAAEELFAIRSSIKHYNRIGFIEDGNRVITPAVANNKIKLDLNTNRMVMKEERLKYAVKTGEVTGKSAQYSNISQTLSKNIELRQQDFERKAMLVIQKAQTQCPRKFTQQAQQRCMNEYANALKRMQSQLTTRNERDRLLSTKFGTRAVEYAALEEQGRQYRQTQDGDMVDIESDESDDVIIADTEISMPIDFSMPSNDNSQNNWQQQFNQNRYPANNGINFGTFPTNYNQGFGMNSGMYPGYNTYQGFGSNPYNSMYNQPIFGNAGGGYNFGGSFGGGNPYGNQFGGNQFGNGFNNGLMYR